MNTENEKYTGVDQDANTGPMKSIEGYIICVTGLNGEVSTLLKNYELS